MISSYIINLLVFASELSIFKLFNTYFPKTFSTTIPKIFHPRRYDYTTNEWTNCAPLKTPRYGVGVAAVDGYIYALGGTGILTAD